MNAIKSSLVCLLTLGMVQATWAQDFGGGLGQIIQQNAAFDAMMYQQSAQIAQQFLADRTNYRMQTGDWGYIPGPVSPMDVSRSIRELNEVYQSSNDAWHDQSARTTAAIDRWSTANRGNWYYTNPDTGAVYELPYTTNNYTFDPSNGFVPGNTSNGTNLYMTDGYGR